jgi:hypothetical protein
VSPSTCQTTTLARAGRGQAAGAAHVEHRRKLYFAAICLDCLAAGTPSDAAQ